MLQGQHFSLVIRLKGVTHAHVYDTVSDRCIYMSHFILSTARNEKCLLMSSSYGRKVV